MRHVQPLCQRASGNALTASAAQALVNRVWTALGSEGTQVYGATSVTGALAYERHLPCDPPDTTVRFLAGKFKHVAYK